MDGGSGGAKDAATIDRIMLRFRPIAPRPESTGDGGSPNSGNWMLDSGKTGMSVTNRGRKKRKYVRVRRKNSLSNKNKKSNNNDEFSEVKIKSVSVDHEKFVKLQLAPDGNGGDNSDCDPTNRLGSAGLDPAVMFVDTRVTVERVITDGSGDMGIMKATGNLEKDTCPVFVTDERLIRVEWVNEAYKRMVGAGGEAGGSRKSSPEVRVRLVMKEGAAGGGLPILGSCSSFTCWVRLEYCCYTWRKEEGKCWRMVPCDVWRMMMEFGSGFAWRMDVKAALGLGLSL